MKKILVATDFSPIANNAVEFAAHVAREVKAELILFSVYKMSVHASNSLSSSTMLNNLINKSKEQLISKCDELRETYQIAVNWELGKDNTIENLKEFTEKNPVDLVVMGIESNLTEYKLFGNTTTAAIKLMQFPLLVVPDNVQYQEFKKIMYACETSYLKENCDLKVLREFVQDFNAQLTVFHVLTKASSTGKSEEMEQLIDQLLGNVTHEFQYISNPDVGEGLEAGIKQEEPDLLVMIPHKLGFFESLVKGSHTSQMTVRTRVPLLVIPNEKAC